MELDPDFKDLLSAFAEEGVRYLLIGGYAVSFHSRPRFTKDLDVWVDADPGNLSRVQRALVRFGAPRQIVEACQSLEPGDVLFMGIVPSRVDIITGLEAMDFEAAYQARVVTDWGGVLVSMIGLRDLILAKRTAGRPQDLVDAEALEERLERDEHPEHGASNPR